MKTLFKSTIIALATVGTLAGPLTAPVFAQTTAAEQVLNTSGTFAKKKYKIKGNWSVVQRDGQTFIKLSDDFKTKNGPDLKIFLSPNTVDRVNGKNAVNDAINLGALKSNKGGQEYLIPAGVNLANFNSVLVHCEAYSVLWGASDLSASLKTNHGS